ncbi:MAG: acetylglutamate kinase [Flavobacteriaceae bacterium]|nr:acetylglutamate kinase [Flavobacteriaceae bacterium]
MSQHISVVKIGGAVLENETLLDSSIKSFVSLEGPKILVHGGGRSLNRLAERLSVPVNIVDGRRITSKANLDLAMMVYRGKINLQIVTKLSTFGIRSVGLSGADGNIILAVKRPIGKIDYGFVGDIVEIDTSWIYDLLFRWKIYPVFCSLANDNKGQLLNINADTIASNIAISLSNSPQIIEQNIRVRLILSFEKKGVLSNPADASSYFDSIDHIKYQELLKQSVLNHGILPKLHNAFMAVENGVNSVIIGNLVHYCSTQKGTIIKK